MPKSVYSMNCHTLSHWWRPQIVSHAKTQPLVAWLNAALSRSRWYPNFWLFFSTRGHAGAGAGGVSVGCTRTAGVKMRPQVAGVADARARNLRLRCGRPKPQLAPLLCKMYEKCRPRLTAADSGFVTAVTNGLVSAAQHMQVSAAGAGAHVSAAAHQGLYASFSHASGAPSPQHHQGAGMCDTYSMSQSQSMNFSPQMRTRPPAPAQPSAPQTAPPLVGVAAAGLSREQQAKMLQQQQQHMLRVQQMRPPPPEYKARFAPTAVMGGSPGAARRPPTAAPTVGRGFPHARAYSPEWRQMLMQQQSATRQPFQHHHQGGFMGGAGGNVLTAQQQQQIQQARLQHQQQLMHHQQRTQNQQQSPMSHLIMHQNQMLNVQGQIQNIHMSQSQSVSMQQAGMGGHQSSPMSNPNTMPSQNNMHQTSPMQPQTNSLLVPNGSMQTQNINNTQHPSFSLHNTSSFPAQTADFNLDFLDNMPSTDMNTAQELLNSLDNSFLNDIL
ncbi:hypothetical protein EVAR_79959_1 [Eumeta japonica]|uniref:Neurogenic protein mastermind n=1 Tax=Eumeta variegata TaxID=151549 RepID=A0A4C1Y421_EUMVA|nr:hypothetical protein EVAR_79959_1 [Eumeta japonica]